MKPKKTPLNGIEKELKKVLDEGIMRGIFPAAAAGISYGLGREKKQIISFSGNAALIPNKRILTINDYFDLASLTKPVGTTLAILCLMKEKKIDLNESLSSLLEKKISGEKSKITIKYLLSHSSGLPAHREYFKILNYKDDKVKKEKIEHLILQEKLEYNPGTKSIYSDLGFILLGLIIEKKAAKNLALYIEEKVLKPLSLEKKILFNPLTKKKLKKSDCVATEECPWRKKILCGEVHDDNCYVFGGVAGHSGLFGNIEGLTRLTAKILDMWQGITKHPNIENKDLKYFFEKQNIPGSSWALGYDTPANEKSSSGSYFSNTSIGHLGFTGTSFWIDPEKNVSIVLLTNRVHPSRENTKIKQYRPYFHDRIMEKLFSENK
jgi:CubicO group peptidase (beta-lactamase class C family)